MQKFYKNQKHTNYELAIKLNYPVNKFYRLNAKTVEGIHTKLFLEICKIEKIDPYKLYEEIKKYKGE